MSFTRRSIIVLLSLSLWSCTSPTSRPVQTIGAEELEDHALLFGSIWNPRPDRRYGDVIFAESVEGERLRIAGDATTPSIDTQGAGNIVLFSQLVEPGEYRFNRFGNPRSTWWEPVERFSAGQIVYMGQLLCINVWSGCMWFSFDQLGRDIYYASEAAPELPWHQTQFRESDFSASMFDFAQQRIDIKPPGRAIHLRSAMTFELENSGFRRSTLETQGELVGGAVYRHDSLSMDAEVLVYPMNLIADARAEEGLSGRLREVVLDREASIAISAYFEDKSEAQSKNYQVSAELIVIPRSEGVLAGRRIDAIGAVSGERVRFYIFSEDGWLIRFRFNWQEKSNGIHVDADEPIEDAIRDFIENQSWPARKRGATE